MKDGPALACRNMICTLRRRLPQCAAASRPATWSWKNALVLLTFAADGWTPAAAFEHRAGQLMAAAEAGGSSRCLHAIREEQECTDMQELNLKAPAGMVALVHGHMDHPDVWRSLAAALRLEMPDWEVVPVQLLPAADASSSAATLDGYAGQVLAAVADTLRGRDLPVVVVGHSMGGQIAELAAGALGKSLAGLVLITPVPLAGFPLPPEQMASFKQRAGETDAEAVKARKLALSRSLDPEGLQLLVRSTLDTEAAFMLEGLNAWSGGHPRGKERSAIDVPVMVIATEDRLFSPEFLRTHVVSRFDTARLAMVEDAGHWPHLEQPGQVTQYLTDFIKNLPK